MKSLEQYLFVRCVLPRDIFVLPSRGWGGGLGTILGILHIFSHIHTYIYIYVGVLYLEDYFLALHFGSTLPPKLTARNLNSEKWRRYWSLMEGANETIGLRL